MSRKPTDLVPVDIDQIVVSDKFSHINNGFIYILLITKKVNLLNYYVLFYLK